MTVAEEVDHLLRDARLAELGSDLAEKNNDPDASKRLAEKAARLRKVAERIDPEHKSLAWGCH